MPIESIPSSFSGGATGSVQRTRKPMEPNQPGQTSPEAGRSSSQDSRKSSTKTKVISLVEWGAGTKDALLSIAKLLRTDIQLLAKIVISQDNDIAEISKKGYLANMRGTVQSASRTVRAVDNQEITRDQVQDFLRQVTQKLNEK